MVFRAERHELATEHEATLDVGALESTMPADKSSLHGGVAHAGEAKSENDENAAHTPNENKMSDGWRESASLRVEGGILSKVRNQSYQTFAPSPG